MPCFGTDDPKLANTRCECRKSFGYGNNCETDIRGFGTVCEDGSGCRGLDIGQEFWGEAYLERGFRIGLNRRWSCDVDVTAPSMNPVDVEWIFTDVSCC